MRTATVCRSPEAVGSVPTATQREADRTTSPTEATIMRMKKVTTSTVRTGSISATKSGLPASLKLKKVAAITATTSFSTRISLSRLLPYRMTSCLPVTSTVADTPSPSQPQALARVAKDLPLATKISALEVALRVSLISLQDLTLTTPLRRRTLRTQRT